MEEREIPVFCYWGGCIKDGPEGPNYDNPPKRAIKISRRTKYNELLEKMYGVTGFDRNRFKLNLICRYPTIVQSSMVKYILLPINDDINVDIMLEVPSIHPSVSNTELYLEAESLPVELIDDETRHMGSGSCLQLLNQRDAAFSPHSCSPLINNPTSSIQGTIFGFDNGNVSTCIPDCDTTVGMETIQHIVELETNDMFCNAYVNNNLVEEQESEEELDDDDDDDDDEEEEEEEGEEQESVDQCMARDRTTTGLQDGPIFEDDITEECDRPLHEPNAPHFGSIDRVDDAVSSHWTPILQPLNWNPDDEIYKGIIFQSKDELKRAIKLYSIKRHRQYEVLETKQRVWSLRCKRHNASGCKWRLRAFKRKGHGLFEITQYSGPHTCVYPRLNRDHRQLDAKLLAQEIEAQVRKQPSLTIAALKEQIKEKFHYTVSYKKMWHAKQKAIKKVCGDWDTSYQVHEVDHGWNDTMGQ